MSPYQFAKKVGIKPSTVYQWGYRGNLPSKHFRDKICAALHITELELLGGSPATQAPTSEIQSPFVVQTSQGEGKHSFKIILDEEIEFTLSGLIDGIQMRRLK